MAIQESSVITALCRHCGWTIIWEPHAGGYWYHPHGNRVQCYSYLPERDPKRNEWRAEPEP